MLTATSQDGITAAATAAAAALGGGGPLAVGAPVPGPTVAGARPAGPCTGRLGRVSGPVDGWVGLLLDATRDEGDGADRALEGAAQALGAALPATERATEGEVLQRLAAGSESIAVPLLDATGAVVATLVLAVPREEPSPMSAPAADSGPSRRDPVSGLGAARIGLLRDLCVEIRAELGRSRVTVQELLSLEPGAIVELDREVGAPADLIVNGTLVARGEVVVVDDRYGLRITDVVLPAEDDGRA